MFKHTFVSLAILILLYSISVLAQPTAGAPPFGSFSGGPDLVDNANLNVHLSIPIISKAGRGLPFSYTLGYDNSLWSPRSATGAYAWTPAAGGWGGGSNIETGYVAYTTTQTSCWYNGTYYYWDQFSNFNYYDGGGTPHPMSGLSMSDWSFRALPCGGGVSSGTATTSDGSAFTVTVQAYYAGAYA